MLRIQTDRIFGRDRCRRPVPARLTHLRLLDFRDTYDARSRLLDYLNSCGFDCWSDGLLYFPHSFLHWRGLGLGNRSLCRFGAPTRAGAIMAKRKKRSKVQKRGKLPRGKSATRGKARKVAKAGGHRSGAGECADWCCHHAWNQKSKIRPSRALATALLPARYGACLATGHLSAFIASPPLHASWRNHSVFDSGQCADWQSAIRSSWGSFMAARRGGQASVSAV
jgi:hypothetical protein